MSKSIRNYYTPYDATSLKTYIQGSSLELATCWKLVPRNSSLSSNVALNATATATNTYASAEYDADFVVNGDRVGNSSEMGWRNAAQDDFPQTVTVDFGSPQNINEIGVYSTQLANNTAVSVPTPVFKINARDYTYPDSTELTEFTESGEHGYTLTGGQGGWTSVYSGPYFQNSAPKHFQFTDMIINGSLPYTVPSVIKLPSTTNADLSLTGDWTITFVLQVPGTMAYAEWCDIIQRFAPLNDGGWQIYGINLDSSGYTIGLYWEEASEATNFNHETTFTPTRDWEIITITKDATNVKFYQNGTLVETVTVASGGNLGTASPAPPPSLTTANTVIGTINGGGAYDFFGNLGYLSIWDSVLGASAQEYVEDDLKCYYKNIGCFDNDPIGLIVDYDVEFWNGSSWLLIPNGSVSENASTYNQFLFPTISTSKIRVTVNEAFKGFAVITEIEAYEGGLGIGATSHTSDIVLQGHPGIIFKQRQGLIPSAVDVEAGLTSAGLEVDAVFDDVLISEESIASGYWNSAYFEIFVVNYTALDMGEYVMFAGFLGDIQTAGKRFRAEGRPLTSKSLQQTGILTNQNCRVRRLGDHECKVNLNAPAAGDGGIITVTGTVTASGGSAEFTDSSRTESSRYFEHGILEFTSGVLDGFQAEIKSFTGGVFELQEPMTRAIPVGTTYKAIRGCNRTFRMCRDVYDNILNYRGFPSVPGLEKALRIKPEIQA